MYILQAAYNPSARRHGGPEIPELETRMAAALRLCLEDLGRRMMMKMAEGIHRHPVIIVGSCDSVDELAEPIRRCFSHEIRLLYPDEGRREEVLTYAIAKLGSHTLLAPDLDLQVWLHYFYA